MPGSDRDIVSQSDDYVTLYGKDGDRILLSAGEFRCTSQTTSAGHLVLSPAVDASIYYCNFCDTP